jgi:hypothetical protein
MRYFHSCIKMANLQKHGHPVTKKYEFQNLTHSTWYLELALPFKEGRLNIPHPNLRDNRLFLSYDSLHLNKRGGNGDLQASPFYLGAYKAPAGSLLPSARMLDITCTSTIRSARE